MSGWMGRVRNVVMDGTCEHFRMVNYVNRFCEGCGCWFLACPRCKPKYCPTCREEKSEIATPGKVPGKSPGIQRQARNDIRVTTRKDRKEKAYYKVVYKTNEKQRAYMRVWRAKNRERMLAYYKKYAKDKALESGR